MKGIEKLLTVFNSLLADELTVIIQYMVQYEMCENWGYGKLPGYSKLISVEPIDPDVALLAFA